MSQKLSPLHGHVADPRVFWCVGARIQEVTDEGMGLLCTVDLEEPDIKAPQHVFFGAGNAVLESKNSGKSEKSKKTQNCRENVILCV